jgi:hypothetical protein
VGVQEGEEMKKISALMLIVASTNLSAATLTYDCKFTTEASPKGLRKLQKSFDLKVMSDTLTNKSYVVGNAGIEPVHAIANDGGISFIEITGSGNVQVTAVTKIGDAVHSRNSIMSGDLVPSQYYGKCAVE